MIAYCWASGLIQFGRKVPDGAIEVARGTSHKLRSTVDVLARHGKGKSKGCLLVPGVPEAETQEAKGDALAAWLRWCAQRNYAGIVFNVRKEPRGEKRQPA